MSAASAPLGAPAVAALLLVAVIAVGGDAGRRGTDSAPALRVAVDITDCRPPSAGPAGRRHHVAPPPRPTAWSTRPVPRPCGLLERVKLGGGTGRCGRAPG